MSSIRKIDGFEVRGSVAGLTEAIDAFNPQYHQDYFAVRDAAAAYLAADPTAASARQLAVPLLAALDNWGAGKRAAPACRQVDAVVEALCARDLHRQLKNLANSSRYLDMADNARRLKDGGPFATVAEFDQALIDTLNALATGLLIGNTNVTYPMKALLLVTGLMPAYDSQVRGGLAIAGFPGIKRTRYLLPRGDGSDARKICVLPFQLAACVARDRAVLDEAIRNSRYPALLKEEYGRVFDVLLFVQRARTPDTALLRLTAAARG